jgi:hypothetical protein
MKPIVERFQADPEDLGGLLLVTATLFERGENEATLRLVERTADLGRLKTVR